MERGPIFVGGLSGRAGVEFVQLASSYLQPPLGTENVPWSTIIQGVPVEEASAIPSLVTEFSGLPVVVRAFSGEKPRGGVSSLRAVMQGSKFLFLGPSTHRDDVGQTQAIVSTARTVGIQHIVFLSQIMAEGSNDEWSRAVASKEEIIQDSGISYTIIRCGIFAETLFVFAQDIKSGKFALPTGRHKFAPIAVEDVARLSCTVLMNTEKHCNAIYDLTGDHLVDGSDLAQILSSLHGHSVRFEPLSESKCREKLKSRHISDHVADSIIHQFHMIQNGTYDWSSLGFLEDVTGQGSTDMYGFFSKNMDRFGGRKAGRDAQHEEVNGSVESHADSPLLSRLKLILQEIPRDYHPAVLAIMDVVVEELNDVARGVSHAYKMVQPFERDIHLFSRFIEGVCREDGYEMAVQDAEQDEFELALQVVVGIVEEFGFEEMPEQPSQDREKWYETS